MKKNIILFASLLFMAYLTGCFIEVSFNIAEWQESIRIGVALIGIIIASIVTAANIEADNY
jgi:hypothetical protein